MVVIYPTESKFNLHHPVSSYFVLPVLQTPSMSSPALASLSSRLTTTSTLLLERQRIISLSLPPSASSTALIIRNLTSIKGDLTKLESQVETEEAVLSAGGRKKGKEGEGELARGVREAGERYDRLIAMLGDDELGRDKAKELRRELKM
jgi:syntaxin 8